MWFTSFINQRHLQDLLLCAEAAPAASEGVAEAEASNAGLFICKHEGTEDEGLVPTE